MSIPTVNVTVAINDQKGAPVIGATIEAKLTTMERYNGYVIPLVTTGLTGEGGVCVLELFPNELGTEGSEYKFKIIHTNGKTVTVYASIPNNDCFLHQVADLDRFELRGAGQVITEEVSGYANDAITARDQAQAAESSAVNYAIIADGHKTDAEAAAVVAETNKNEAIASASAAATSAANASTSETNASTSATTASTQRVATEAARDLTLTYRNDAQAARNKAELWAEQATDVAVETGEYSAKHHAIKASYSASTAATARDNATTKAGEASVSAGQAATSASNAAASAVAASGFADDAKLSKDAASVSAAAVSNNAAITVTRATEAAASATAAANSATSASTSATTATTQAGNAQTRANAASVSAGNASNSAATATQKATDAANSATAAQASATNAANSASAADTSKTGADSAKVAAENARDDAQASATAADGSKTAAAASASAASTSATNAANSASAASISLVSTESARDTAIEARDDAIVAKNAAEASEASALSSKNAAATSAANASAASSVASTKANEASASASSASTSASTATTKAGESLTSAINAASSAATASSAKTAAESARDTAVSASNTAVAAKDAALASEAAALSSKNSAATSAANASAASGVAVTKASEAAASASSISGGATDAVNAKNAALAAQAQCETIRDGLQTASTHSHDNKTFLDGLNSKTIAGYNVIRAQNLPPVGNYPAGTFCIVAAYEPKKVYLNIGLWWFNIQQTDSVYGKITKFDDVKLLWRVEDGGQRSAIGPDPVWSYASHQYTEDGVIVGSTDPDFDIGVNTPVPAIHGDKGVWCGPSYANLLPSGSEDLTTWNPLRATVAITGLLTPQGDIAYRVTATSDLTNHRVYCRAATPVGSYTALLLLKKDTTRYALVTIANQVETTRIAVLVDFDLKEISLADGSGRYTLEEQGGGWFLVTLSGDTISGDTMVSTFVYVRNNSGVGAFAGATEAVLVGSPQLTATSVPMPYVPPGTTVTSAAGTAGGNGIGFLLNEELTRIFAGDETKNIIPWSENFTAWNSSSSYTITPNAAVSPRGDITASLFKETFTPGDKTLACWPIGTPGTWTYSVYVKPAGRNHVRIHTYGFPGWFDAVFDIQNGVRISGPSQAYSTLVGDGWCRVVIPGINTLGGWMGGAYVYLHNGTKTNYTGDGESGVYIWGAQLTRTATEQPYVATNGIRAGFPATCTVAAEVTMGVGNVDLANNAVVPVLSLRNSSSDIVSVNKGSDGTSAIMKSYGLTNVPYLVGTYSRNERHIKIVQTNAEGTQFRVGNKRIGIDSVIKWGAWVRFYGSFNPLTHLRLAFGTTVPLWFRRVMVSNRGGMIDTDIETRMVV